MIFTVYSKVDCPWCTRVKKELNKYGIKYKEVTISSVEQLPEDAKTAGTVPQVYTEEGLRLGGYGTTRAYLAENFSQNEKRRTVFNADNTGHETGDYPLFLGEDLGFVDTINRPYPILDTLFQDQMAQIWNEFEIDITQDRQDMIKAPADYAGAMVETILWQHLADSIASRSITGILLDHVSNSDLENWYNAVALFESIHARTYSHIIKQTFVDPNDALRQGYANFEVIKRSTVLANAFDDLANLPYDAPVETKREHLYVALAALYMLERVNFMGSFAITFGIAELGYYQGIAQLVVLIARDELLHARGGKEILKIEISKNPESYARVKHKIQEVYDEVLKQEHEWADYLLNKYKILGLSAQSVKDYVTFRSQEVVDVLQLEARYDRLDKSPLPYMEKYLDSSKVQVAAQEMQLTSYLLNSLVDDITNREYFMRELKDEIRSCRKPQL